MRSNLTELVQALTVALQNGLVGLFYVQFFFFPSLLLLMRFSGAFDWHCALHFAFFV